MNRIIKFRAWSPKEKKMYGIFDLNKEESIMSQTGLPLHIAPQSYFVWLQFTGLKDKNEKEIYDLDLVREGRKIYKVFWNQLGSGGWWFAFKNKEGEWQHASKVNVSQLEVIGNIYENPELLK